MDRFDYKEFDCKCGNCTAKGYGMQKTTLAMIDAAAVHDQKQHGYMPWVVRSGMRCWPHNKVEGGSDTSSHPEGYAVDIATNGSRQRSRVVTAMLAAGFTRIGIGKSFVHADNDINKATNVMWRYE